MKVLQARAFLPGVGEIDLLHDAPFGGALLIPFANRIRGRLSSDGTAIDTAVLGRRVRLPANWSGREAGAERCAMHGLMLDTPMQIIEQTAGSVTASVDAGDFGGHWLSRSQVRVEAALDPAEFRLSVTVQNAGAETLPIGIGWHPYFALPSGRREQARLHLPARQRALVNNYDDVFPTGALQPVAGTAYAFTEQEGTPLGSQYFDDCFVDLIRSADGQTRVEISDPAAAYRMRLTALSPHVRAVQLYAPPDQPFVVVEPQFNFADPFSTVWPPDVDTGMVCLEPGGEVRWSARWELL